MRTSRRKRFGDSLALNRWIRGAASMLLALSLSACSHSSRGLLQAPAATADPEERFAAFEELRPVGTVTTTQSWGNSRSVSTQLQLANDYLIGDPTALLDVVPEDSPTAQSVNRYSKHRKRVQMWKWIRRGLALSTIGLWIGSIVLDGNRPMLWGAGATGVAALTTPIFQMRESRRQSKEIDLAFQLYERDLMKRLGLKLQYNGPRVRQRRKTPEGSIASNREALQDSPAWIQACAERAPKLGWVR